jgi:glutamyl-tRNA reductase
MYVDHESETNHDVLAHESERLRKEGHPDLLITCHRVEKYGESVEGLPLLDKSLKGVEVSGTRAVFERLANIAAGTKSQIIGEWPIFEQVRTYLAEPDQSGKVSDLGQEALKAAHTARREVNFYSPDHATIALNSIRQDAKAKLLLVFGAGMVGMNLARTHSALGFDEMVLVTRNKKKARKTLKGVSGCKVLSLEEISKVDLHGKCNVVVASTNLSSHGESISSLVADLNCGSVIDVCGESLFSDADGHITLEGSAMMDLIRQHNLKMEERRHTVESRIRSLAEQAVENLEASWHNGIHS